MEKNTRIIIGAVLILFIAMISFRFDTLTGAVTENSFESTAVFDINPTVFNQPTGKLSGTVETAVITTKDIKGKTLTYGKTYIDTDRKVCIVKEGSKSGQKICALLHCTKEDSRNNCVYAKFSFTIGTLDYGTNYNLRMWEYPGVGKKHSGKYTHGGEFTIKEKPIQYR